MIRKQELENAKKVFQNGSFKDKAEYLWEYYKWHLLTPIVILGILGSIIYTNVTAKEYVLQGIILNTSGREDAGILLQDDFSKYLKINTESEAVCFDTGYHFTVDAKGSLEENSYDMLEIMITRMVTGEIDFVIGEQEILAHKIYKQYFQNLSDVFSKEFMQEHKDKMVLNEKIPLFVDVSNCEKLQKLYVNGEKQYVMGFVVNSSNYERAIEFLEFLMTP